MVAKRKKKTFHVDGEITWLVRVVVMKSHLLITQKKMSSAERLTPLYGRRSGEPLENQMRVVIFALVALNLEARIGF